MMNSSSQINLSNIVFHLKKWNKSYLFKESLSIYNDFPEVNSKQKENFESIEKIIFSNNDTNSSQSENLYSIFNYIGDNKSTNHLKFNPQILSLEKSIFPKQINSGNNLSELWQKFNNELSQLVNWKEDIDTHLFNLYYLLKKYFWLIPSSKDATISFYDEVRFSATFAEAIFIQQETQSKYPFTIISCELSGIQNFLYNISSKYAAKSLRGRSFYLQLILEDACSHILDSLKLRHSNIIYSSGGKFFLLAPNNSDTSDKIKEIRTSLQDYLWNKYQTNLYVCMDSIDFCFENKKIRTEESDALIQIGELWKKISDKTSSQKTQKLIQVFKNKNKFNELFSPFGEGGSSNLCSVTGEEGDLSKISENELESIWISKNVKEQIDLGKDLVNHQYIIFGNSNKNNLFASNVKIEKEFHSSIGKSDRIYSTLKPNSINNNHPISAKQKHGFRYFGGSTVVSENGIPLDYEKLAGNGDFKRLGYLRMDIDNLGKIFINGLSERHKNFAAYSTLSSLLDWFFSGYLNTIRESEEFRNHINIIYSGGDDLFAVGRWDKIIHFAYIVQKEFKEFTGRKDITISGGISIVGPKFPIGKAAIYAGEAEDLAKNHIAHQQEKNSINFFGISCNWEQEFTKVLELKIKIYDWLANKTITKGLLYQLFSYYEIFKSSDSKDLSWKWNAAYNISRRKESANLESKKALEELQKIIFIDIENGSLRFDTFVQSLKWAELEYRTLIKN